MCIRDSICPFGEHLKQCEDIECTNSFKCPETYCIPYRRICDGVWDCPYGVDEMTNCSDLQCPGFFHCKGLTTCLHPIEVCDGKVDCTSTFKDDEIFCIQNYNCPKGCMCIGLAVECYMLQLRMVPIIDFQSIELLSICLLYTSPSPRDGLLSRMPSSA